MFSGLPLIVESNNLGSTQSSDIGEAPSKMWLELWSPDLLLGPFVSPRTQGNLQESVFS